MTPAPTHPVDVLLILTAGDQVLLALCEGTGYADGMWNLPSGKLETGEDVVSAVIREAREEIGVALAPDEPQLITRCRRIRVRGGRLSSAPGVDQAS